MRAMRTSIVSIGLVALVGFGLASETRSQEGPAVAVPLPDAATTRAPEGANSIATLRSKLADALQRKADLLVRYNSWHPAVHTVEAEIRIIERRIAAEQAGDGAVGGTQPAVEAMLVLIYSRSAIHVPMPDRSTCEEAVVQTQNELNPTNVYCSPRLHDPRVVVAEPQDRSERQSKLLRLRQLESPSPPPALLVLSMTVRSGLIELPMPDLDACTRAILEAKSELNPHSVYCVEHVPLWGKPNGPASITVPVRILRNQDDVRNLRNQDDTCIPCIEGWWVQGRPGPWWEPTPMQRRWVLPEH